MTTLIVTSRNCAKARKNNDPAYWCLTRYLPSTHYFYQQLYSQHFVYTPPRSKVMANQWEQTVCLIYKLAKIGAVFLKLYCYKPVQTTLQCYHPRVVGQTTQGASKFLRRELP